MNITKYDEVFDSLETNLATMSAYNPSVKKKIPNNTITYPLVVITEITNQDLTMTLERTHILSTLGYEINIYTKDGVYNNERVADVEIAREISHKIDLVMHNLNFKRISNSPTPNIDTDIYRITMRYNGTLYENRNQIF